MAALKQSLSCGKDTQRANARGVSPKPAAKKAAAKRVAQRGEAAPRVSMVTAGGYTVFGSPVQPAHRTTKQIAAAIAELD